MKLIENNGKSYIKGYLRVVPTENVDDLNNTILKSKNTLKGNSPTQYVLPLTEGYKDDDFFNENYSKVYFYVFTDEYFDTEDTWCINIMSGDNEVEMIKSNPNFNNYGYGWRKIVDTTNPHLQIPFTFYDDEVYGLEIYRYKIFPTLKRKDLSHFINLLNKNVFPHEINFHIQWDTSDHNEWYENTDEDFIIDYQKRMGIYEQVRNHDEGFTESDLKEMYEEYFKPSIYIDLDDNTINVVKDDFLPIFELKNDVNKTITLSIQNEDVKFYPQERVEQLIRWAMQSKGYTPEYEVRDFFKEHDIVDYNK